MLDVKYEFVQDDELLQFRVSGFATFGKIIRLRDAIIEELKPYNGRPFKVMFDLRGLKALDPRTASALKDIDTFLYESTVTKCGTVFDSIIAKLQHARLAKEGIGEECFEDARTRVFADPGECLA